MISYKEYKHGKTDLLIAACDSDLLGKTFHDSEKGLKLEVKKDFYGGSEISAEEFGKQLKKATIANLVGEKTISKAIDLGLVATSSVLKIQGVPHVQIVRGL
ncbi:TPA: DUF424 family protein [archaeon]|uniref:DUF424 family protein n=1 Tax=Candidatus Naiadarchaeum limnaeum TaxID=2756139 RepID=A0A832UUT1_9ARCH|nr:DUF424 family protein [Candidatus Naiadarchaeum limnaeum]